MLCYGKPSLALIGLIAITQKSEWSNLGFAREQYIPTSSTYMEPHTHKNLIMGIQKKKKKKLLITYMYIVQFGIFHRVLV